MDQYGPTGHLHVTRIVTLVFVLAALPTGRAVPSEIRSTYLGGSGADTASAVIIHPATGDVYVAGGTASADFPGGTPGDVTGNGFVARLSSDLASIIVATYLEPSITALAVHPITGDIYVASGSSVIRLPRDVSSFVAAGFPATIRGLALHPANGDVYLVGNVGAGAGIPGTAGGAQPTKPGQTSGFVARLSADLTTLVQATYLGGTVLDNVGNGAFNSASALAIHPVNGDLYVTGQTDAIDFPATQFGAQPTRASGEAAFITRLPASLTSIIQSTYLGGDGLNLAVALAISANTGDIFVGGQTSATDFPGVAGGAQPERGDAQTVFVSRLNASLELIIQSTYLGPPVNFPASLAIHPSTGDVYVGGFVDQPGLAAVSGGWQPQHNGGPDGFVSRFNAGLTSVIQSTYVGSDPRALAIHPTGGEVYAVGTTGGVIPGFVVARNHPRPAPGMPPSCVSRRAFALSMAPICGSPRCTSAISSADSKARRTR